MMPIRETMSKSERNIRWYARFLGFVPHPIFMGVGKSGGGKRPALPAWQHGVSLEQAISIGDSARVCMPDRFEACNLGALTGPIYSVFDCENISTAEAVLRYARERGARPWAVALSGRGAHILVPSWKRNLKPITKVTKIPGIDGDYEYEFLSNGRQHVLPGSKHYADGIPSGKVYRWVSQETGEPIDIDPDVTSPMEARDLVFAHGFTDQERHVWEGLHAAMKDYHHARRAAREAGRGGLVRSREVLQAHQHGVPVARPWDACTCGQCVRDYASVLLGTRVRQATRYLAAFDQAERGERNKAGWIFACSAVNDFALPPDIAYGLLFNWNHMNAEPLEVSELHSLIGSALKNSKKERGLKLLVGLNRMAKHKPWCALYQKREERRRQKKARPWGYRGLRDRARALSRQVSKIWLRETKLPAPNEKGRRLESNPRRILAKRLARVARCGYIAKTMTCKHHGLQASMNRPCDDPLFCPYCANVAAAQKKAAILDQWPEKVFVGVIESKSPGDRAETRGHRLGIMKRFRRNRRVKPVWYEGYDRVVFFFLSTEKENYGPYCQAYIGNREEITREQAAQLVYDLQVSPAKVFTEKLDQASNAYESSKAFEEILESSWAANSQWKRSGGGQHTAEQLPIRSMAMYREETISKKLMARDGVPFHQCAEPVMSRRGVLVPCRTNMRADYTWVPTGEMICTDWEGDRSGKTLRLAMQRTPIPERYFRDVLRDVEANQD